MSTIVTLRGVNYTLAQDKDKDCGAYMTTLINAMINAYNNTPLQTNVTQWDAVVSSVAVRRTHATLEAVIADAAVLAGSNVLIDGDVFTQNVTLNISKKLYIYGLGDSGFEAGAGLGANPIIRFSVSGSRFQGITLDANGNNPTYGVQVDAALFDICLDVEMVGVFAIDFIDNQATDEALVGFVKTLTGNYLLPVSTPGTNSQLSNLSGLGTAINEELIYDADNTYDFCSDALEAAVVWTHEISHGDAVDTDLNISTASNDGNINLDPNGTGQVVVKTTLEIDTASINENTGDLLLGAAVDIVLDPASDNNVQVDIGGVEYSMPYIVDIQAATTVGEVGDVGQFKAGRILTLAEANALISNGSVLAMYNFANGAMTTDETGNYPLTDVNTVVNANGIMGADNGALFTVANSEYMYSVDLLDTMVNVAILVWVKFTDGIIATDQTLINKDNVTNEDRIYIFNEASTGRIVFTTEQSNAGNKSLPCCVVIPNGATGWYPFIFCWNTTYGKRIYSLFGCDQDPVETTLMLNGTAGNFCIGAITTPDKYLGGTTGQVIVWNTILSDDDARMILAAAITEPAALTGKNYKIHEFTQPLGESQYSQQTICREVARYGSKILLDAYQYDEDDKVALYGEVL